MKRIFTAVAATYLAATLTNVPAVAQTCGSLLGDVACGAPGAPAAIPQSSGRQQGGFSVQSLGRDLSPTQDAPAMFGAITFRGRGAECSGPFRMRQC
jgi:hypothetical protein